MARFFGVFACIAVLGACTHSNVSTTPILLPDGTEGYRYTGRANFGYQLREADRVMAETCASFGKTPLVIDQQARALGGGAVLGGGVATAGLNQQQDILFRCR